MLSKTERNIKLLESIKFCHLFQPNCEIIEELLENKAMYSQGEERYLKDLDCVNIVKSIRELKALSRAILTQQQRKLLAFERESVLPNSATLEAQEAQFIHNKVPQHNENSLNCFEYIKSVDKFVTNFSCKPLSEMDIHVINQIVEDNKAINLNLLNINSQSNTKPNTVCKIKPYFRNR